MDDKVMGYAKSRYENARTCHADIMAEVRSRCTQTIISKGILRNVLPYENELHGYKVNGKQIPEQVCKDDCYRYSLDKEGRVILIEGMSDSLGNFHYATMYFYSENQIETMYWAADSLYNVTVYILNESRPTEVYFHAQQSSSYRLYEYENTRLSKIIYYSNEETPQVQTFYTFLYKQNGDLMKIIRDWACGGTEITYSAEKINYKKLETRLLSEMETAISDFMQKTSGASIKIIAFGCFTGHGNLSLYADDGTSPYPDSPADWLYPDFADIGLVNAPLHDNEEEKVLIAAAKAIDSLTKLSVFVNLPKADGFRCTMSNHDIGSIEKSMPNLQKILKDNKYFQI